ncbi:MAG TPA: carbohydrate kinase [Aestuariivirgaceae bacterium]|jgi:fructokinase
MIVACGEALIDLFLYDRKGTALRAEAVAGGSPYNVAIGLARLGCPVAFCGGLSTDGFGEFLAMLLREEGVDLTYALRTPRLSTVSVVSTDERGQARYAFHGEGAADRGLTPHDLAFDLPPHVQALTFGSYTLAVEPVASAFHALMEREARRRVISIDPNIRPTVIGNLAGYDRHLLKFLRHATIVKASEEDIALLFGSAAKLAEVAEQWTKHGPSLVVITRGNRGATAFHRGCTIDVAARKVDVVDTVGAGDAFHAGFLASLAFAGELDRAAIAALPPESLERALHYGITAAAIACGRRGADLPTRREVEMAFSS